jgi:hypothetical protein
MNTHEILQERIDTVRAYAKGFGDIERKTEAQRIQCEAEIAKLQAEQAALPPAWTLPAPPKGAQWHRVDWEKDMLPEGWRPLLETEHAKADIDECRRDHEENWEPIRNFDGRVGNSIPKFYWVRTSRPLPPEHRIAEGHNPDKLTVAQVGEGFELLPAGMFSVDARLPDGYEMWGCGLWSRGAFGFCMTSAQTFRRRIPAPAVPWSKPADLGFPWPLMRLVGLEAVSNIEWTDNHMFKIGGRGCVLWGSDELKNYEHTRDGVTFQKCEVQP